MPVRKMWRVKLSFSFTLGPFWPTQFDISHVDGASQLHLPNECGARPEFAAKYSQNHLRTQKVQGRTTDFECIPEENASDMTRFAQGIVFDPYGIGAPPLVEQEQDQSSVASSHFIDAFSIPWWIAASWPRPVSATMNHNNNEVSCSTLSRLHARADGPPRC